MILAYTVQKEGDVMVEKLNGIPEAYAEVEGSAQFPEIHGIVYFFEVYGGTIVMAEIYGLPDEEKQDIGKFFAFHIHEGASCGGNGREAFGGTGMHFNPERTPHPEHAGDLPPLMSTHGAAWSAFYTGRFYPEDVVGKTVVIHSRPDDFKSQPSGDSGDKIACGEIREWQMEQGGMEPEVMEPHRPERRMQEPGMMMPEMMEPRTMNPGTVNPRTMQPDTTEPQPIQPRNLW